MSTRIPPDFSKFQNATDIAEKLAEVIRDTTVGALPFAVSRWSENRVDEGMARLISHRTLEQEDGTKDEAAFIKEASEAIWNSEIKRRQSTTGHRR